MRRADPNQWLFSTQVARVARAADGRLCVADLAVEVDRVVGGGEADFTDFGTASVEVKRGWHTLPAKLVPPLRVSGPHARAVIASAAADYERLFMEDGSLTFAGPGFEGDDAAALLFGPPDAAWRGALSKAAWSENRGYAMAHSVSIKSEISGGDIRLANPRLADAGAAGAPDASLAFLGIILWTGDGGFRGNGVVTFKSTNTITTCYRGGGGATECDAGKRGHGAPDRYQPAHLRDAVTLVLAGTTTWGQGHILLGEGATLRAEAALSVADDADARSPALLATARDATPGRQDHPRNGWYTNPACGDLCAAPPQFKIADGAAVAVTAAAAVFEPTLFNRGALSVTGALALGDGGGGDGAFDVAGALAQRAGVLDLERADLAGAGEVGVDGGRALLPGTVAPRVRVGGGECVQRGRRIAMNAITVTNGTFAFLADAANVSLANDLVISGGALRFPERDSRAAVHRNHLHTGNRNLDRGKLWVHGHLNWTAGAISGNGDVDLMAASHVKDGLIEKFARVINHAAMMLEDGLLVAETEGYLENRGTVEMVEPRSTYAGMIGRRPNPRQVEPVLQYQWEDNMLYTQRVMLQGEDSARDSALGVS